MTELRQFIADHCVTSPIARVPLHDFQREFFEHLPDASGWTRSRLISELIRAGFIVATADKVQHVAGVTLRGQWVERDGALEFAHA